jgi:hypothetical protein
LEFFCWAGFYKDTAPTALKGKAAPVFRSGFGIIPANLFYCTTARKNRVNTDPFTCDFLAAQKCVRTSDTSDDRQTWKQTRYRHSWGIL